MATLIPAAVAAVGVATVLVGERWPLRGLWAALAATVALHALRLGYHVDDAGIVYAYARSLWGGAGLVPQPGALPIEGFSNPAWVALNTALAALGTAAPMGAELLELGLSALALVLVREVALTADADEEAAGRACCWVAASGVWFAWSTAGLEGSLYAVLLLVVALGSMAMPGMAAVAAAVAAWTRPEGAAAAIGAAMAGAVAARDPLRSAAGWAGAAAGLVGLGIVRWIWLGTWVPNTVMAKWGGPAAWPRGWLDATLGLGLTGWVFLAMLAMDPRRARHLHGAILAMGVAWCLDLFAGGDWMRHARFLAPWIPLVTALSARALFDEVPDRSGRALRFLAAAAGICVLVHAAWAPTVPWTHGLRRGPLYQALGAEACGRTSVATPDIGGVLWSAPEVVVLDLAGLIDPGGRAGGPGGWPARIRDVRPALVDLHDGWAGRLGLGDPVLTGLGYRVLCRRDVVGPEERRPTLWIDGACVGALQEATKADLDDFCARGSGPR